MIISIERFGEVQPSSIETVQGMHGVDVAYLKCSGRQRVPGPGILYKFGSHKKGDKSDKST